MPFLRNLDLVLLALALVLFLAVGLPILMRGLAAFHVDFSNLSVDTSIVIQGPPRGTDTISGARNI